jgi:hypothetical protein
LLTEVDNHDPNRNANSLEKQKRKNDGTFHIDNQNGIQGTTFYRGKDGRIRNSQGQVIDLRDSGDFGKGKPGKKIKKTSHISNKDMMDHHNQNRNSKISGLPVK